MRTEVEFSQRGYTDLLKRMKAANYAFVRMSDALSTDGKRIILRHDIDFSVEYALEMARLEKSQDIEATYFFMTTSEFYNIFNERNRKALRQIHEMGHEIGLHWDSRFVPRNGELTDRFFAGQLALLSEIFGHSVTSASQHVPTDTPAIKIDHLVKVEAYSNEIMQSFEYVSDSSMAWRDLTPLDLINANVSFQFLAHPIWWMSSGVTQEAKFESFLNQEIRDVTTRIDSNLCYMKRVLAERHTFDERFARRFSVS